MFFKKLPKKSYIQNYFKLNTLSCGVLMI